MNRTKTNTVLSSLLLLMLVIGSISAQAGSAIYLTNSTNEPLEIQVSQFGDAPLVEGQHWDQTTDEIAPQATEKVLEFNRYSGLKSGATYHFETHATGEHSTVTLRQRMQGTWYGSTIEHGASGDDFHTPLFSDRNIHRFDTHFDSLNSVMGFKAVFTGGYDDFEYTISNRTEPEPLSGENELKVLTYNIWALPLLASNIGTRLDELPDVLQGYDVLLIQEAFDSRSEDLLLELADEYPYQTEILDGPNFNLFNGGVVTVSRYPIVNTEYWVYPDCVSTDCFTDRGVVYTEIIKDGRAYHLTNTHAASSDSEDAQAARRNQFQEIRELVDDQEIPAWEAVLMGGDFNVDKINWPGEYAEMQTILRGSVPPITGYTRSTFDPEVNVNAAKAYDVVEYLDYVIISDDHRQPHTAVNDVRVPRSISDDLWGVWDFSDHFPVMGGFEFE